MVPHRTGYPPLGSHQQISSVLASKSGVMRRRGLGEAYLVESRGGFCIPWNRAFYLVPERSPRTLYGELSRSDSVFKKNKVKLPKWLDVLPVPGSPWPDREAWLKDRGSPRYQALYDLLRNTVDWQLHFIVKRFIKALPRVIAGANPMQQAMVKQAILELQQSTQGLYAMVDYVNFKGEGLNTLERYSGKGWGLVQVLETMRPGTLASAPSRFADAAKRTLRARVANAPKERNEGRWLTGWLRRVDTYREPFIYQPHQRSEN